MLIQKFISLIIGVDLGVCVGMVDVNREWEFRGFLFYQETFSPDFSNYKYI